MLDYLKLFRIQNLLVVALTQYLFRYCIVLPVLNAQGVEQHLFLSNIDFFLIVLTTVFISAAGYAINDYFDLRIDRINKPHKIILGRKISRRKAISAHFVLNIIAVIIGFYISYKVRSIPVAAVFIIAALLLWLYSIRYKRKLIIGNVLVSFLSASVVIIVWLFEYVNLINRVDDISIFNFEKIHLLLFVYAFFAFLLSVIREIIKDIEDIKGDKQTGCKSIPIVFGKNKTRYVIIGLTIFLMVFVLLFQTYSIISLGFYLFAAYMLFAVQIPLIVLIFKINNAKDKISYTISSRLTKLIIFTGVFSMFLFYYYFY